MTTLTRIRLEMARNDDFPQGSSEHGYEFVAPVTVDGHIDAAAWAANKSHCGARRFWRGQPDQRGLLRHVGQGWRFDYDGADDTDDEPFFKLDRHRLATGAYVSLLEQDGVTRVFKVIETIPLKHLRAA